MTVPARPFSVAWTSMALYREVTGPDPLHDDLGDLSGARVEVATMRTAVLAVLDRHVDRRSLGVPLLSEVCAAR